MVEKTITMSIHEYKMLEIENKAYKERFDELAQEKMVYLTLGNRTNPLFVHQISGQIVEKDELLSKMQKHLSLMKKRGDERETNYIQHIATLEKQLDQVYIIHAPVKAVTKWWHKLLK